jgi:choline dehydrogenase-like flavoprotein
MQRLVLECDVEQSPDPQSRIRLSARTDRLGQPLAQIDWRVSETERLTVATLGKLIVQEFLRKGLPAPKLADWIESGRHDEARFSDVAHPSGSTRMAQNPSEGVVDDNCKIHGIEGIYIAGSSIFPTNGHSNPTLMIVALAIRLADRLKATVFR